METAKMTENKTNTKILKILLKDFAIKPTITSLAKETGMSRVGIWKVLKKLKKDNLIILSPIGAGKTSTYIINLNWENPLVEKTLSLALTEDALKNQRWRVNFAELEDNVSFLILFGSVLNNPKEANDLDIILVVKNKQSFHAVNKKILKIQQTQLKKIHNLDLTKNEFIAELKGPNKAYLDALKKGVVLYGQENFVNFVKNLQTK